MLAFAVAGALVVAPSASAAGVDAAPAECKPGLTIVTDSQTEILEDKTIRVVVDQRECEQGERIRLNAKDRVKGKRREVAKPMRTEFAGAQTAALELNKKGEKRVKRCDPQSLIVKLNGDGLKAQDREKVKRDRVACGGNGGGGGGGSGSGGGNGPGRVEPAGIDTSTASRCDFLDGAVCLLPFPNDHFTAPVADPAADQAAGYTGLRINFNPLSMPRNRAAGPDQPARLQQQRRLQPGQHDHHPRPRARQPGGIRAHRGRADHGHQPLRRPKQPIVVIDAATGERQPIWAEIDSNPILAPDDEQTNPNDGEPRPEDVNLLIRPAANFEDGHRYIVALRDLRKANGDVIGTQRGFELYRDDIRTRDDAIESRRQHFERIFRRLGESGIERKSLYLAWDFTVASERNLTERALAIRDDAFAQLGDENLSDMQVTGSAPAFKVTSMTENPRTRTSLVGSREP